MQVQAPTFPHSYTSGLRRALALQSLSITKQLRKLVASYIAEARLGQREGRYWGRYFFQLRHSICPSK